jgi:hypothetical protein
VSITIAHSVRQVCLTNFVVSGGWGSNSSNQISQQHSIKALSGYIVCHGVVWVSEVFWVGCFCPRYVVAASAADLYVDLFIGAAVRVVSFAA